MISLQLLKHHFVNFTFILLEVLHLIHYLTKYFWCILRRIAILHQTNLDVQFQLFSNPLIIQPVSKWWFRINDFLYLTSQTLAFLVDDNSIYSFILTILEVILVPQGNQNIIESLLLESQSQLAETLTVSLHAIEYCQGLLCCFLNNVFCRFILSSTSLFFWKELATFMVLLDGFL